MAMTMMFECNSCGAVMPAVMALGWCGARRSGSVITATTQHLTTYRAIEVEFPDPPDPNQLELLPVAETD